MRARRGAAASEALLGSFRSLLVITIPPEAVREHMHSVRLQYSCQVVVASPPAPLRPARPRAERLMACSPSEALVVGVSPLRASTGSAEFAPHRRTSAHTFPPLPSRRALLSASRMPRRR